MNKAQLKFCIFNTIFAALLFLFLNKSHVLPGENSKLFFLGPAFKNWISSERSTFGKEDFLFVNTAFDRMLVPHFERLDNGLSRGTMPRGNVDIVDREKLFLFFSKINKTANYKYLVCNIIFDHPSEYDSSLGAVMRKTKKMVVAQGERLDNIQPAFRNLPIGLDMVYAPSGVFNKYRLFEQATPLVKSIPLHMYEELHHTQIDPGFFASTLDGTFYFNDFTPEHWIKATDELAPIDLGDILKLPDSYFHKLTKDRIIVLGDYYTNPMKTVYESKTPATLILINAFLSLEQHRNTLTLGFSFFLLLILFFFSYLVIAPQSKIESRVFNLPILGGLLGGAKYVVAMACIGLLIYLIFGNNINLIYMGLFFYAENIVINRRFHYLRMKKRFNFVRRR